MIGTKLLHALPACKSPRRAAVSIGGGLSTDGPVGTGPGADAAAGALQRLLANPA
jgi:hypothetical protein